MKPEKSLPLTESDTLAARLEHCMLSDQRRLRSQLGRYRASESAGGASGVLLDQLRAAIEDSASRCARRGLERPRPTFPLDLPVSQRRAEIAEAIEAHPVVVICGETGSGKTTQLPKICLSAGRGVAGMIGHTQPRRIAARTVASRIARELETEVGGAVGYKIRFSDKIGPATFVKLMTDGILLSEIRSDRSLEQYDTIIIDEAHERTLNIDFLLGYLKRLTIKRRDLRVIVTSATIDPERFSRHFEGAPIIEVSGRTYPVETRYRNADSILSSDEAEEEEEPESPRLILAAVEELWREGPGDILIFHSGERQIRESAEALRKHHPPHVEVLPLYARLSSAEQNRVFQPHGDPRIVLATNVAETSLTVPGIRYVIDPGYARISRYSARSKVQRLPVEKISRASADQRRGRCGRVGPGICIRLFSEEDYSARDAFTAPEILRTNLASVILQMKALDLGGVEDFPFLEPPDYRMVRDGYQTLYELAAINEHNELTPEGRQLARLPIDPRIGRMVLEAQNEGCLPEVLVIAAALSVQDPRERPLERQEAADTAHQRFTDERSDFLSYLKLWDFFQDRSRHLSASKLRKLCRDQFLSYTRLREWLDVHQQLQTIVGEMGLERR